VTNLCAVSRRRLSVSGRWTVCRISSYREYKRDFVAMSKQSPTPRDVARCCACNGCACHCACCAFVPSGRPDAPCTHFHHWLASKHGQCFQRQPTAFAAVGIELAAALDRVNESVEPLQLVGAAAANADPEVQGPAKRRAAENLRTNAFSNQKGKAT
jgi:hypothetical protein